MVDGVWWWRLMQVVNGVAGFLLIRNLLWASARWVGYGPRQLARLRRATHASGLLATTMTTSRRWFVVDDGYVGMLVAFTRGLKGADVQRH